MFKSVSSLTLIFITLCPLIFQQQQLTNGLAIVEPVSIKSGASISSRGINQHLFKGQQAFYTNTLQVPPSASPSTSPPQTSPMSATGTLQSAAGALSTRSHSSAKRRDISLSGASQLQSQHHHRHNHRQQQQQQLQPVISEYKSNFTTNYADQQHLQQPLTRQQQQQQSSATATTSSSSSSSARQKKTLAEQWLRPNSVGAVTISADKKPSELFKSSIVQRDLSHKFQHHFTPTSNHLGRPLFESTSASPSPLMQSTQPLLQQSDNISSNFSKSLIQPFNHRPNFLENISKASGALFNGSSVSNALLLAGNAAVAAASNGATSAGSGMINSISRTTQPVVKALGQGAATTLFELGAAISGSASERLNSIVRTGPILSHHFNQHHFNHHNQPMMSAFSVQHPLRALMPSGVHLFASQHAAANAQDEQHSRATNHLRPTLHLLAGQPQHHRHQRQNHQVTMPSQQQQQQQQQQQLEAQATSNSVDFLAPKAAPVAAAANADQMIATANQLGVAHLGPQSLGASESNSYNSIASLQDYPPDRQSAIHHGGNVNDGPPNGVAHLGDPNMNPNSPQNSVSPMDDQRGGNGIAGGGGGGGGNNNLINGNNNNNNNNGYNDYQQVDQGHYDSTQPPPMQKSASQHVAPNPMSSDQSSNSRSSMIDGYTMRAEHKSSRGDAGGPVVGAGNGPLRSSIDSFEEMTGLPTSEYERDLADLDEEFSRQSYRRPSAASLMSDSFLSLSPERYEGRRYRTRPNYADYSSAADYLSTAGSMSSIVPRSYQRTPLSWSNQQYADQSDIWADSSVDFSPLGSYVSPNHAYATYRWRPRYQRVSPYSSAGQAHYLTGSASEQQLQPATYNLVPSYSAAPAPQAPPPQPTETISIALSPLAAAAAAAASALAAADKTRHHNHGWLTLPRITTTNSITGSPGGNQAAQASSQHAAAAAAAAAMPTALQATYIHRPAGPYALGSMPIYAIAPRPPTAAAAAPQAASASYIPTYFHAAGTPAIIAYRPTGVMPTGSLLTSASFAYPLRLPVVPQPAAYGHLTGAAGGRGNGVRPFYSDLQYAETKPKTNLNNNNNNNNSQDNNNNKGSSSVRVTSLSAIAKNLSKKMFGSASQIRPQHVSPPSEFSLLSSAHVNSSSSSTGGAGNNN